MYNFLVNPASRSGRGKQYWNRIKPLLDASGIEYDVRFSEKHGDLSHFAEELTGTGSGADIHIVALGGDGTVNEVIQGIRDFSHTLFSYIPTGSSNDLARDLHFSKDPEENLKRILESPTEHKMDIGTIHFHTSWLKEGNSIRETALPDRRFVVSCGIGFDAAVCVEAMSSPIKDTFNRIGLGKLTYLGIALKQLLGADLQNARVDLLDEKSAVTETIEMKGMIFSAFMNHPYEGGGFLFCPGARSNDGILDMCLVSGIGKLRALTILPTAFSGNHVKYSAVNMQRAHGVDIHTSIPLWIHTDGEADCKTDHMTLHCQKQLLRFYY